jgi:L-cystine transport system substrate-binding protein
MKFKNLFRKTAALTLALTFTLGGTACGKEGTTAETTAAAEVEATEAATEVVTEAGAAESEATEAATESTGDVKTVKVAWQTNSFPLAYEDESGKLTGYEIEVMKLVDEALPEYEFEFELAGTQDAQYAGLSAGKYDIVLSNAFYTKDRDEAYALPENPLGASLVGIIVKKGTEGITDFASAASAGAKLSPILAGDGLYYVVYTYNEANPDNQINLEATDSADSFMNSLGWVAEGRYDFALWPKNYYEQLVIEESGDLHDYDAQLDFYECRSVYTYPIVRKDEQEVADAISGVLGTLREEGTLSELSTQFYGYDAFQYDSE